VVHEGLRRRTGVGAGSADDDDVRLGGAGGRPEGEAVGVGIDGERVERQRGWPLQAAGARVDLANPQGVN
jgi:hypothetical protein